jgi:hypothetical protein
MCESEEWGDFWEMSFSAKVPNEKKSAIGEV